MYVNREKIRQGPEKLSYQVLMAPKHKLESILVSL